MFERVSRVVGVGLLAGLLTAGTSAVLAAQEGGQDCQLEGTEATRQAEQLIDQAAELDTVAPEQARSRYEQALTRVRLALKQNEEDPVAHWLAGRAQIGLGDYVAADSSLSRFATMKPGCANLVDAARQNAWVSAYNAGIRAYQAGDDSTALHQFERANVIREDARSLNNAALLRQQRQNLERAEELYRRSLEVARETEQLRAAAINLAELLRSQDRLEEALGIYEEYLRQNPSDVQANINYALALRSAASADSAQAALADSAQAVFQKLLDRDDLAFTEWFNVGLGLMRSQTYEGAKLAFRKARQMQPYDKPTMQNLVEIHRVTGTLGEAASLADTLVDWYPYQKDLYRSYIQVLDQQGRTQRVQQLLPQIQGMPLSFSQLDMIPQGENRYVVRGQVEPGSRAGQTVTVPFEFLDASGNVVTTREASIEVPSEGSTTFQLVLETETPLAGFRHGSVQGGS